MFYAAFEAPGRNLVFYVVLVASRLYELNLVFPGATCELDPQVLWTTSVWPETLETNINNL